MAIEKPGELMDWWNPRLVPRTGVEHLLTRWYIMFSKGILQSGNNKPWICNR